MKIGVQLYGFKHIPMQQGCSVYKAATDLGYTEVEPCVLFTDGFPKDKGIIQPEELLHDIPQIKEYGLSFRTVHAFSFDYKADSEKMRLLAKEARIACYVLKLPEINCKKDIEDYVSNLLWLADKLKQDGISLCLHNESRDTLTKIENKSAFEWVIDYTDSSILIQADTGNLLAGGVEPVAFLWKYKDRIASVHFKDMKCENGSYAEARLGAGDVDLDGCYQFARAMGIPKIVDMDSGTLNDYKQAAILLADMSQIRTNTSSKLWSINTDTFETKLLRYFDGIIEAPNWLKDGDTILYNSNGAIYRYSISKDIIEKVATGKCSNCNNDHVPSPSNEYLAVSHSDESFASQIYIVDMANGETRQVTSEPFSFLHGWSPDGKELAYCGIRFTEAGTDVDVYTIPIEGGKEKKLTSSDGYADGCEYSPDGNIWYCSTASGLMQINKMNPDGTHKIQLTDNDANNWFPHVSPDNQKVVYLTFKKDELEPNEHLPNMYVSLNIMNTDGGNKRKIIDFFGGQGSINVNSWAPDSQHIAIVTYELHHRRDSNE